MVSRRNYVAITSMMLVIFFLFIIPQFWKATRNPYSQNSYVSEEPLPGKRDTWQQPELTTREALNQQEPYMVYLGNPESREGYAVVSWAEYSKTRLAVINRTSQLEALNAKIPRAVIVEGSTLDLREDLKALLDWNKEGVTLIFAGLPEVSQLQKYPQLRELLGIRWITQESVTLESIHLFPGFLLGGECIYSQENKQFAQMVDLNMDVPWFRLTSSTEVYLMGEVSQELLPEQQYRNERLPALLWRRSINDTNVFAVNGDYLSGNMGIGIMSAILAEDSSYYLYPVVNTQVLTVANFPSMADENREVLYQRYGKGAQALVRDLLWPSMESMSEINSFRMSCFEMTQYCYDDDKEPDKAMISYYLRLMRERNAEAGVSLQHGQEITLTEKWNRDQAFLAQDAKDYLYNAAFLTEAELGEWNSSLPFAAVSAKLERKDGLLFFLDEDTLCQTVTHDLLNYSCRSDLELRSIQTALAYTNPMLDMHTILWPEEGAYGWEVAYEKSASNLHTYWKQFDYFDRMTVSESDRRIRSFLAMDYSQHREDNTIFLELTGTNTADFLLRTHKELVAGVEGGSAQELETGIWLIHAQQPQVKITMKTDEQFEY